MIKKFLTTTILITLIFFASCAKSDTVSKNQSDGNLLTSLLQAQQAKTLQTTLSSLIEVQGTYKSFSSSTATSSTSKLVIASTTAGVADWIVYDSNNTSTGSGANFYSIVEFSNTTNVLYYEMSGYVSYVTGFASSYSPNSFGRITWTEPDSTGKFYFCEDVFAKTSLENAKLATTSTTNSSNLTTGCNGFSWSRAEKQ